MCTPDVVALCENYHCTVLCGARMQAKWVCTLFYFIFTYLASSILIEEE